MSTTTNPDPIGLSGLEPPYERSDMLLIEQAARGQWQVDDDTKRKIAAGIIATRDDPTTPKRTRHRAIRCLAILESHGWLQ